MRGISLLETVIACLLFATISVAMVGLWATHHRLLAQTQHRLVATYVAKQLMEEQLNQPVANIVPIARGSQTPISMDSYMNGALRRSTYEYSVQVVETPETRDVTVTVFWTEGDSEHEVHLETLLFTLY
ncbi:MAG: hypothetical protein AB1758_26765 [Candidatus Eremiobacterota bacterium]